MKKEATISNDFDVIKHRQGLWTLIVMQFKEKMSFSFKADKKGALTKLLLFALLIIGVGVGIGVLFALLGKASIFAFGEVPASIFNFFFVIMFMLSLLACLNGLTNSLYFSEDNQVLLSYPVKSNTVFFSKIIVYYFFELVKNFGMFVPYFFAYGIVYQFQFIYFPWVIFSFLIISFIPVAISGFLSIPFMYIKMLMKKYSLVQNICLLILLVGITGFLTWIISLIPERLDIARQWNTVYLPSINNAVAVVEKVFTPITLLTMMITGYSGSATSVRTMHVFSKMTLPILGGIVATILVSLVFTYFVVKPLFFKMASKPFEYSKKIIKHDFKISTNDAINSFTGNYFVAKDKTLSNDEMKALLRKIKKEEKLFLAGVINTKRVLKMLNKYSKCHFEEVIVDEHFTNSLTHCFAIQLTNNIPSLVYVEKIKLHVHCYDPNHLSKTNHKRNAMISTLFKEILVDIRTPGVIISNYIMVALPPMSLLLLNTIFKACGLNDLGHLLAVTFDVILVLLIVLSTNISMASIYSREGKTSYMLKAMPIDFTKTLGTKLIIRALLMIISIILLSIVYKFTSTIYYARPLCLCVSLICIYSAHLLWSAELDYMNPQDKLYAETGEGNISNPNETLSSVIGMLSALIFGFITFFFLRDNSSSAMIKIMLISMAFLGCRICLFLKKIKAYSTSRGERGKN